jgi:hypothetical protein
MQMGKLGASHPATLLYIVVFRECDVVGSRRVEATQ